jgi:hypothetical protein
LIFGDGVFPVCTRKSVNANPEEAQREYTKEILKGKKSKGEEIRAPQHCL